MTESTLSSGYAEIASAVGDYLGYSPTASAWSAAQTAVIEKVTNLGYHEFLLAHDWPFLDLTGTVTVWDSITGTMTVGGVGNVTITDTTNSPFYPTCIGHKLVADTSETEYTITGYTSSSVVTVSADASADTGDTFTITGTGLFRMPDDFGSSVGDRMSWDDDDTAARPVAYRSSADISVFMQKSDSAGIPQYAAFQPAASDGTSGQRFGVRLYPPPDSDYTLTYQYRPLPDKMVSATAEFPYGGSDATLVIRASCLAVAEIERDDMIGVRNAKYEAMLARLISRYNKSRPGDLGSTARAQGVDYNRYGTVSYDGTVVP